MYRIFIMLIVITVQWHEQQYAQTDQNFGRIVYDMYVNLDKAPSEKPIMNTSNTIHSYMVFNAQTALFIYGDQTEYSKTRKEEDIEGGRRVQIEENYGNEFGHQYLKQLDQYALLSFEMILGNKGTTNYRISEELPDFKWVIDWTTKKKINDFFCYKATGKFRGRNFTAWFTRDIPVQHGPWKMSGLPGLILEAYSDHYEIWFALKSLNYPIDGGNIKFELPEATQITWEEYVQKWHLWAKKTMGYQASQQLTTGGDSNIELSHMENIFKP